MKILYLPPSQVEDSFLKRNIKISKFFNRTFQILFFFNKFILKPINKKKINIFDKVISYFPDEINITSEFHHYRNIFDDDCFKIYTTKRILNIYFDKRKKNIQKLHSAFCLARHPKILNKKYLINNINDFDKIFFSVGLSKSNKKLLEIFSLKFKGEIIAFDNFDHEKIYINKNENLHRNLKFKIRVDKLLKKDIPLSYKISSDLIPISPVPVKRSLITNLIVDNDYKYDFLFIGRKRTDLVRDDRVELIDIISKEFRNIKIIYTDNEFIEHKIIDEYCRLSKVILSPAGRVWCSYRHSELVKYNSLILIPKPNCHIYGPELKHLQNCFFYETKYENNKYKIQNLDKLVNDLKNVLNDEKLFKEIIKNYKNLIFDYHTSEARKIFYKRIFNII